MDNVKETIIQTPTILWMYQLQRTSLCHGRCWNPQNIFHRGNKYDPSATLVTISSSKFVWCIFEFIFKSMPAQQPQSWILYPGKLSISEVQSNVDSGSDMRMHFHPTISADYICRNEWKWIRSRKECICFPQFAMKSAVICRFPKIVGSRLAIRADWTAEDIIVDTKFHRFDEDNWSTWFPNHRFCSPLHGNKQLYFLRESPANCLCSTPNLRIFACWER